MSEDEINRTFWRHAGGLLIPAAPVPVFPSGEIGDQLLRQFRAMEDRRLRVFDKIVKRVDVTNDGCWLWTGPTSGGGRGGGYGRMCLDGQTVAVHIVMFTTFHGYIPGKKQIDHVCRNRLCCNPHPHHLEMVTPKKNAKRRSKAK